MTKEKEFTITVNGTRHEVEVDVVTFEQVVELAFPDHPTGPDILFSVTFEKAKSEPHNGTLAAGGSVTVRKDETIFDVTQTNRS